MSLAKLRPEVQRGMAITVPLLVTLFSAFLIVPKVIGIWAVNRTMATRSQEAEAKARQNRTLISSQIKQRLATRPEARGEQLAFLKDLSRLVAGSGVRLVSYRPPQSAAANRTGDTAGGHSTLVKPVVTEVTVAGSYRDLVTLFHSLTHADRLFAVADLQVHRETYPRLTASFRLVRYVTPLNVVIADGPAAPMSGRGS
jgi:hypothetical protein